jgi:transposase InsO family protein
VTCADVVFGRRNVIRDRDAKYPDVIDAVLRDVGIITVLTGVRVPRMNAITERWAKSLRSGVARSHIDLERDASSARAAQV